MLEIPVADAHVHLWDPSNLRYPWLDDIPLLNKAYLPDDYREESSAANVEKMVFVQCECDTSQYLREVQWITSLKSAEDRISAIVSWAPLEKGEYVRSELEVLKEYSLVKGIRRIIQFEEDIEFSLRPDFIKGVKMLPEFGFSFDICVIHYQMENAVKFARQCPDVKMILDHIGKPDIKNGVLKPWKSEIKQLADMQNIYCKLSGLVTEADHNDWTAEELKPYIEHIIECFGFDRVMFGGDWPVVKQAGGYKRWFEALISVIGHEDKSNLQKLFYDNAVGFYRLSDSDI